MYALQRRVRLAIALCYAALLAGIAAHLALTDIFHGERDVHLEWRVVQLAGVIVVSALVFALRTLAQVRAADPQR